MVRNQPTAADQLMLELINRARENPQKEADRLINGQLNEGVPLSNLITLNPKQPLAFNPQLMQSAYNHSQWMLDNNIFSHTGVNNSTSRERMTNAEYNFIAPWGSGENIAWKGTTGGLDFNQFVVDNYDNLFIDFNYPNRGHRVAILKDEFQEIGIANLQGIFTQNRINYNAVMTTQNFAYSANNGAFLTGVIYTDDVINDNFYTIGEGIGNIRVIAQDNSNRIYETLTWESGGYSLFLPSGDYRISFVGKLDQDPEDDLVITYVDIESENVKVDVATNNPFFATGFLTESDRIKASSIINENTSDEINTDRINSTDNLNPIDTTNEVNITDTVDNNIAYKSIGENNLNSNPLLNQSIYRLQNNERLGTYLYVGEEEANNIRQNFPQFRSEGLAFQVGFSPMDDLTPIYRFHNNNISGTYLFVGEEEANNIRQNFTNFQDEGIAFYVYSSNINLGNSIYRFQNLDFLGTYLFVGESEKNYIVQNFSNFALEGVAFNVG